MNSALDREQWREKSSFTFTKNLKAFVETNYQKSYKNHPSNFKYLTLFEFLV
jgi:hypothetical protein